MFSPTGDLDSDDLAEFLAATTSPTLALHAALASGNVTMIQDGTDTSLDLLSLVRGNARATIDFPDLTSVGVWTAHTRLSGAREILVVADTIQNWPVDTARWSRGDVNRFDVGSATLYELPVDLGQMGPRATIIERLVRDARGRGSEPLLVDLGQRDGDLGLERIDRARVDYAALDNLGYSRVVPYELELALGAAALGDLLKEHPRLKLVASNVKAGVPGLFIAHQLVQMGRVRIGLFGLVDPDLRGVLGKASLRDFSFEPPVEAAARETAALRAAGADAVIALSNLHPRDNALVSREVMGIDAIVADLHVRWSPESLAITVDLPDRPRSRPGSPALVTRSFANGLGVGSLDLVFKGGAQPHLATMSHTLSSVTDRTPVDPAFVARMRALAAGAERPRGQVLLPDFSELAARRPSLAAFDSEAAQGRVSKHMWEEFLARLLRYRAGAEVAVIRKLPHFPPAMGDLHESDVRSWLWTEDAIVALDVSGAALKGLLTEDTKGDLVTSGVDRATWKIHGRTIDDLAQYRVATTDLIVEGSRARWFADARRTAHGFRLGQGGMLDADRRAPPVQLRTVVLDSLRRLRSEGAGVAYLDRIARLLDRDPPFEPLFTFGFDHPTLFGSLNQMTNNGAYGQVPESRVTSDDNLVVGLAGRYLLGYDRQKTAVDFGIVTAFSRQSARHRAAGGGHTIAETADDLQFDATVRRKLRETIRGRPQPYVRTVVDTEFTPTINPSNGLRNPRQRLLREIAGVRLSPRRGFSYLEGGYVLENDLAARSLEHGLEGRMELTRRFGPLGHLTYRQRNDVLYFFPAAADDATDLALTWNTIHEVLIPLVNELSLSVGVDAFVFKGKIAATSHPGASVILRVGLTYDRVWKPRYQPFF